MRVLNYTLDADGNPVPEPDLLTWAAWFQTGHRRLAETCVPGDNPRSVVRVSTVFLGTDHSFGDGPPVLWETMIFGGPRDQAQWRYHTRAEAAEGHARAVAVCLIPEGDD